MLRSLLTAALRKALEGVAPDAVAMAFGGIDSMCVTLSLMDAGYAPTLYTYGLKGYDSPDLAYATQAADAFALPLVPVYIPNDVDTLLHDVRLLVGCGLRNKVEIQCLHGHMYMVGVVRERFCCMGECADILWGTRRIYVLNKAKDDKAKFDSIRHRYLRTLDAGIVQDQRAMYGYKGISLVLPFQDSDVIQHMMGYTWRQLNTPHWKALAWQEYPELGQFGPTLKRQSQQIASGLREHHDKLLRTPLNKRGHRSVIGIYNDLAKDAV